jgi:hypothetical protein
LGILFWKENLLSDLMLARLLINGGSRELVDAKRSVVMSAVGGPLFIISKYLKESKGHAI